jgi:hypothetical protein
VPRVAYRVLPARAAIAPLPAPQRAFGAAPQRIGYLLGAFVFFVVLTFSALPIAINTYQTMGPRNFDFVSFPIAFGVFVFALLGSSVASAALVQRISVKEEQQAARATAWRTYGPQILIPHLEERYAVKFTPTSSLAHLLSGEPFTVAAMGVPTEVILVSAGADLQLAEVAHGQPLEGRAPVSGDASVFLLPYSVQAQVEQGKGLL